MTTIGEFIRARRIQLGMTQDQLAKAVGISRAAVGQWEKGVTAPTRRHAPDVALALGVDLGALNRLWPASITLVDSSTVSRNVALMDMAEFTKGSSDAGHPRVTVAGDLPGDAIALRVCDTSMSPEFADGDLVVVSRSTIPIAGDVVVAEVDGDGLLRKYQPRGIDKQGSPVFDLLSTSPDYPTVTCNSSNGHKVLAVVVAHWKIRKR